MGKAPDLGGGIPQAEGKPLGIFVVGCTRGHALAQRLGRQPGAGQQRGDAIMQVPAQPSALLRHCLQDSSARRLQLGVAA
jgi:hypothetical protein